jgi:hypothetical protein
LPLIKLAQSGLHVTPQRRDIQRGIARSHLAFAPQARSPNPRALRQADRVGLGLWNSIPGTLAVEFAIFAIGLAMYLRQTTPRDRVGSIGLWSLVGFLLVVYLGSSFGPPPPTPAAIAWSAQSLWLLVIWGYWIDNHRRGTHG